MKSCVPKYQKMNSFNYKIGNAWNMLPFEIKDGHFKTVNTFSKHVKKHYISKYVKTCAVKNCYICNKHQLGTEFETALVKNHIVLSLHFLTGSILHSQANPVPPYKQTIHTLCTTHAHNPLVLRVNLIHFWVGPTSANFVCGLIPGQLQESFRLIYSCLMM